MATAYDIIIRPIITERAMAGAADKKYVFEVAKDAGKIEIKKAVEEIFGVKVRLCQHPDGARQGKAHGRRPSRHDPDLEEGLRSADGGFQDHRVLREHGLINGRSVTRNVYQNL